MGSGEPSSERTNMKAMSGKLLDAQDREFDLTALMARFLLAFDQGFPTIDFTHWEIHEAESYISDAVVDDTELILAFRTPDTDKHMHFWAEFASEGPAHMDILRGPTWNTGTGAQNPIFNKDENSTNDSAAEEDTTGAFVASMNVVQDPVGLAGGTIIHDLYTWADKKTGGVRREEEEVVLRRNTLYAVRLTSDAVGAEGLQLILRWYENTR